MPKYRKLPIVIEAFKYGSNTPPNWFNCQLATGVIKLFRDHCSIETLEGKMRAEYGDWIIQGVNLEIYPCKDEIFKKTYELVIEASHAKDN